jgi:ATP-binding cassette subfamily B multidrug efflux pump
MDNREKQAQFVHEALVIMGVLALLCFVCRLWPILLLVILGVLIAAVRMRLPDGYQMQLEGSGSSLSQGQRQLLAIARVAVADPPVLLLDEATSSIDTRTEKIVQDGMDRLMKGRTVFVIAHRLSTIKNSDVIMVLDHGRIVERGNHESLLAKKGMYYQLYTGKLEQE